MHLIQWSIRWTPAFESSFPLALRKAYENGDEKVVNAVLEILMETDPNLKFNMKHGMWTTGSKTPIELIQKNTSFTLDGVADKNQMSYACP